MPAYLIRVSQPAAIAAAQIEDCLRMSGSHFVTHAHWQRQDGITTGMLVIEAEDKRWALGVVPPSMRARAIVDPVRSVEGLSSRSTLNDAPQCAVAA